MHQFMTIFILSLLTSLDNAIVVSGIARRTKHNLMLVGLISSIVLTGCRTALIMGIVSVSTLPGFRLGLGLIVLWVAVRLTELTTESSDRKDISVLRLILLITVTDMALSVDNIVSVATVSKNPWLIGTGVFFSLVPLFLLLPFFANVMKRVEWVQILAAGFVAELAIDAITDDKLLKSRVPTGWTEFIIRSSAALIVILYGFWRYRAAKRSIV